jgi:uncharacterized damage-inducible protein DinB
MSEGIKRLIEHLAWSDKEVIRSLKDQSTLAPRALQTLAHVVAAEKVWLCRIMNQPELAPPVWAALSLDECEAMGAANAAALRQLVDPPDPGRMQKIISYVSSRGDRFENTLEDILLHVCMHGSYHRGQIAALVRAGGGVPINTDYITYRRLEGGRME